MKDTLYNIIEKFVLNNNFNINPEDFKLQLKSNPSYPSVKAISDALDYFGIENLVANVPKDALEQLPHCFLAVLENDEEKTITQVIRKKNIIKLFKDDGTKGTISVDDFKTIWNGTIIAIEENSEKIKKKKYFLKNPLIPVSLLAIGTVFYSTYTLDKQAVIYTLLTVLGCCCSYFIARESLGLQNEATSKICNSSVNNTSCSSVINSKSSKFFELVSLSDASITFFVSTILVITLFGYSPSFFFLLSISSIPIILYSVYSQAFEIKKWCPLCLGIASVLITQVILTSLFYVSFELNMPFIIKYLFVFTFVYFAWSYLKSILIKSIKHEKIQTDFFKFKRNENLFNILLTKNNLPSNEKLSKEYLISYGNLNASLVITSVTNPLCGFCTKSFEAYDVLLKTYGGKIRLDIIFNVPIDSLNNPTTQIAQQIIDIYKENPINSYKALKDWFSNREVEVWQNKYEIPSDETSLHTLEIHNTWCNLNEINYTPATLIGNHFFPKEYDIKDMGLFIDGLIEKQKNLVLVSS